MVRSCQASGTPFSQYAGSCRRRSKTARSCRSKSARFGCGLSLGVGLGSDAGEGVDASVAEPVAGSFEGHDVCVVDDAVDHGQRFLVVAREGPGQEAW